VDGGEVAAWEDISVEEIVEDFGGCMDLLCQFYFIVSIMSMVRFGEGMKAENDEY
jgi:hypothetical protein